MVGAAGQGGSLDITLLAEDSGVDISDTSNASVASLSIGTASATREVFALVSARDTSSTTANAVTIGGVTATLHKNVNFPSGSGQHLTHCLCSAVVPTGTTATVAVTWSNNVQGTGVSVFALDKGSAFSVDATSANDSVTSDVDVSVSVTVASAGEAVLALSTMDDSSIRTNSWSNITEYHHIDGDKHNHSSGYDTYASTGSKTLTDNWTNFNNVAAMSAIVVS